MGATPIANNLESDKAAIYYDYGKKRAADAKRTVRVYSADGGEAGFTYPKRAKGLVKKGRARYVNDFDIRLNVSDVNDLDFTEENKMDNNILNNNNQDDMTENLEKLSEISEISNAADMPEEKTEEKAVEVKEETKTKKSVRVVYSEPVNKLYFKAREWIFNKDCKNNAGSRSFIEGPDGVIAEAYTIGDWSWNWTEIISKTLLLPKNTLNTFTFWLNGGENDNYNEVCRFEVVFNNDWENRLTYNLNRNFIRPVKRLNGWELYEIPFRTENNEYTQLKFVSQRAFLTIMDAQDVSAYEDIPDTVDKFEGERPQRHNIVFDDGWPSNKWYGTAALEKSHGFKSGDSGNFKQIISGGGKTIVTINGDLSESSAKKIMNEGHDKVIINGRITPDEGGGKSSGVDVDVNVVEDLVNSFNVDDLINMDEMHEIIGERINDRVNDALSEAINDGNIDIDDIADNVVDEVMEDVFDNIRDRLECIVDELQEKLDSVDDLNDNLREDYNRRIKKVLSEKLKGLNI